jgi:hypothetical protein
LVSEQALGKTGQARIEAALRYALHESWREFLAFVRGEDFINDDGGQTENCCIGGWPY